MLKGFSGSALLNTHRRQSCLHEIAGITSFGVGCGIGIPSVYTRISAYLDWIEDIVWLSGNGSSSAIAPPEVPIVESSSVNRTFVKSNKTKISYRFHVFQKNMFFNPLFTSSRFHELPVTFLLVLNKQQII